MKQLCGHVEVRLLTATFTVPKAPVPPLSSEIEGARLRWIGGAKPTVSSSPNEPGPAEHQVMTRGAANGAKGATKVAFYS